jgi:hypothetical protein
MGGIGMSDSSDLADKILQGIPVELEKKLVIITPIMTAKQYAAIHLKVPMSGDEDIDKMIRESRRADFAGQALAGMMSTDLNGTSWNPREVKGIAFRFADAMLDELEKEAEK